MDNKQDNWSQASSHGDSFQSLMTELPSTVASCYHHYRGAKAFVITSYKTMLLELKSSKQTLTYLPC